MIPTLITHHLSLLTTAPPLSCALDLHVELTIRTYMKAKLTLYVNDPVIRRAKMYAKKRGTAVSKLVEDHLRALAEQEGESFSQSWRGKFAKTPSDDERFQAIAAKHVR